MLNFKVNYIGIKYTYKFTYLEMNIGNVFLSDYIIKIFG